VSGELNLKYSATNKTILALILGQNRSTRWNGTSMAAISAVSDANWTTGMVTLTEQGTSNSTKTATYVGNFPAGITQAGEYVVEYYLSTAAAPGSLAIGGQDIWWNGSAAIRPAGAGEKMDLVDAPNATALTAIGTAVWTATARSLTTFGTLAADVATAVWTATSRTLSGFGTLVSDIWAAAARTITGGTITTYTGNTPQTGDAYTRLGAPASTSVSADIAAVKVKTDNIPANPASETTAAAIKAKTDNLPAQPAAVGSAMTLQSAERDAIAAALLDLANTIDGKTLRQALQIIAAVLAGKVSGAGSGIETFRGLDDQHDRVVVTADATGNRTNVTYS